MNSPQRQHLRLATYILEKVRGDNVAWSHRYTSQLRELTELGRRVTQARTNLERCYTKGWMAAASFQSQVVAELSSELVSRLSYLPAVAPPSSNVRPPLLREVYEEVQQLTTEFDDIEIDLKKHILAVTVEPITLDDVGLGPFKIRLELDALGLRAQGRIYQVIALEPHPAASNELVTHPHVRDEELCEGDASASIRNALLSGRLCDFFLLVRSVLQHYNAGSPYVALNEWEGTSCQDCGHVVEDDGSYYCEGCSYDFCDNCMASCRVCEDSRCSSCLEKCGACNRSICGGCRALCDQCDQLTCDECLEDQLCPACREKEAEDEPTESATSGTVSATVVPPQGTAHAA